MTDKEYVSDSLVIHSSSLSVDSNSHEESSVIVAEKNHRISVHDSTFVMQVIEKTIVIRQDSTGKELGRETNTTITNNRNRVREVDRLSASSSSSNVRESDRQLTKAKTSNDSIHGKKRIEDRQEETIAKRETVWQRIGNFFSFIGKFVVFLIRACIFGMMVYVVGVFFVQVYRMARKILQRVKMKMKNKGDDR